MSAATRSNPVAEIAFCSLMCHLMLWMAFKRSQGQDVAVSEQDYHRESTCGPLPGAAGKQAALHLPQGTLH